MDRLDMCEAVKLHRVPFVLNPSGEWARFPEHLKCFVEQPWTEFKYFVDGTNQINPAIVNVPNNCGGVYIFLIKPNVIYDISVFSIHRQSPKNSLSKFKEESKRVCQ